MRVTFLLSSLSEKNGMERSRDSRGSPPAHDAKRRLGLSASLGWLAGIREERGHPNGRKVERARNRAAHSFGNGEGEQRAHAHAGSLPWWMCAAVAGLFIPGLWPNAQREPDSH